MNTAKLRQEIKAKGFTINSIAKAIEMTHTGFTKALDNSTLRIDTLEKIAEVLEVPFTFFFDNKDEEKFIYFKQMIKGQSIYVEVGYHIQELMGDNLNIIAKSIVEFAQQVIPKSEREKLLESNFITRSREVPELKLNKDDDFNPNVADHLTIIKKYILETDIISSKRKELDKAVFEAEVIFVNIVMHDSYINFLLKEQIIDEEDVVSEILMSIKNYLGFISSGAKGLLLKNFKSSALRKSIKRFLEDERFPIVSQ